MKPPARPAMPCDPGTDETIFAAALQWEKPEQRAAYLDEACAGQPELRARIEGLLRASSEAQTFLENPVGMSRPTPGDGNNAFTDPITHPDASPAGFEARIGRYKLLQQIGEGGCGTVFMAEQEEPVRRRVALKVIKLGMDTKSVVARFEAERQALALMDHPNIAKVLDAGATESGRPFFVMELVRGIPITRYCDENRLPTRERLDLFIRVCQAIQHAHQKGIIHRDIKPSNILVTLHDGTPVPKVIDFGIAKATEGRLTDRTLFTAFQQFIGTPAYMSPEQAEMSGFDIDTRSDIYSLGVLLYELLTGKTPFDAQELARSGLDEIRRRIREVEPPRPSTRLSTLGGEALATTARAHGTEPATLRSLIHGDLDWIVMKCLEKDRTRRYETANGLAADLRRHMVNEPVVARPPSTAYRVHKAWKRNKVAFAAGGALVFGLLTGISALVFALLRERALNSESARADSIATFVTGMLNDSLPKLVEQDNMSGIRVVLDSADRLVSNTLTNSPAAELMVRETLARYVWRLDLGSERKLADRLEFLLPLVPDDRLPPQRSRDILRVDIACAQMAGGDLDHGRSTLDRLAGEFRRRGPSANVALANALGSLAQILNCLNQSREAEPLLEEAHRLDMAWGDEYATTLLLNGKPAQAEEVGEAHVRWFSSESSRNPNWSMLFEVGARLGALPGYWPVVQARCLQGKFREAEALVADQLKPHHSRAWSSAQIKNLQGMQFAIQSQSGRWREAASGLVALATDPSANLSELANGMAAAIASGDSAAFDRLSRVARMRGLGNPDADAASMLFKALILRPRGEDLSSNLPHLLAQIENAPGNRGSAVGLGLMRGQLAYRNGNLEEALQQVEAWTRSKSVHPIHTWRLHEQQSLPIPDYWRAMILARLHRAKEAEEAYKEGVRKEEAGFNASPFPFATVICFTKAFELEAREVLRSEGIPVTDSPISQ